MIAERAGSWKSADLIDPRDDPVGRVHLDSIGLLVERVYRFVTIALELPNGRVVRGGDVFALAERQT
jgi:hypothetical protein